MIAGAGAHRRRLLAPEVIQASAMDCGPAALACLLQGFGIDADYARLRHACQTDVDGTSIDRIEQVAVQLGLSAEQVMVPADHVLRAGSVLPAVAVVLLPGGITHFVVAWRRAGPLVQVMDPGHGRRLVRPADLLRTLYLHRHLVGAGDWREWAATEDFQAPLRERLAELGLSAAVSSDLTARALADTEWRGLAALDAAVRLTTTLVQAGDVRGGEDAARVTQALSRAGRERLDAVPAHHWSVLPAQDGQLLMTGAVLVRVRGRQAQDAVAETPESAVEAPAPALAAAVSTPRASLAARLLSLARKVPRPMKAVLAAAAALGAAAAALEALLLNALLHSGLVRLEATDQLALVLAVAGFASLVLSLDVVAVRAALAAGRRLESLYRLALLAKLPRIADRHLGTWLRSDLAHRAHSITVLHELPLLAVQGLRVAGEIGVTALALAVLFPGAALPALAGAVAAVAVPLVAHPLLAERHVRLQSLEGALSRHFLDALMGSTAARAHAAEHVLGRDHAARTREWERAGYALQRALVPRDAVQYAAGLLFAAAVIVPLAGREAAGAGALLLVFWALRLPALGAALSALFEQALSQRSTLVRLLEILDAPEEPAGGPQPAGTGACALALEGVSVMAGGHPVLQDVDLSVEAGEHVAIVGPSGSGKSTLLGLFLGWHAPAQGRRRVQGLDLEGDALAWLRARTAWIEPGVRLWNRSLLANLLYGADPGALPLAIEAATLRPLIDGLPAGAETSVGEEGRLLSGGEGQKVRAGRAFARAAPALVVLDEGFRGLDGRERQRLLRQARGQWRSATLLCATHDLDDTLDFDRVVVMDGGRLVETGRPQALRADPTSHYARLLEAHAALAEEAWGGRHWRRLRLDKGRAGVA